VSVTRLNSYVIYVQETARYRVTCALEAKKTYGRKLDARDISKQKMNIVTANPAITVVFSSRDGEGVAARSSTKSGGEQVCLRPRATVTEDPVSNGTARRAGGCDSATRSLFRYGTAHQSPQANVQRCKP
jgi:hypothetical protein